MKLVDRYILNQLLAPFAFGLTLFSTLWLVNILMKMIDLFVVKGVALPTVIKIFILSVPVVLTTATPMAVLLASLMAVGRLSSDSEITALRAAGVSFPRIVAPMLAFGLAASLGVLGINELVVPRTNYLREQTTLNEVVLVKPLPKIAKDVFFEGGSDFTVFVRSYDAVRETMADVTIFQFGQTGVGQARPPRVTEARTGRMVGSHWVFEDGTMQVYSGRGRLRDEITFERWAQPIDTRYAERVEGKPRSAREMSLLELWRKIHEKERHGRDRNEDWVELYFKTAFPWASLCLLLVGAPLALGGGRSGTSRGIGLSVFIMFAYYTILAFGRALGDAGKLPPLLGTWLPNMIMLGAGILLMWWRRW